MTHADPAPCPALTWRDVLRLISAGNVQISALAAATGKTEAETFRIAISLIAKRLLCPLDHTQTLKLTRRARNEMIDRVDRIFPGGVPKKLMTWLELAAGGSGMYPGIRTDLAPKAFGRLYKAGLITFYQPHNPSHKERAIATYAGLALLEKAEKK